MSSASELQQRAERLAKTVREHRKEERRARRDGLAARRALDELIAESRKAGIPILAFNPGSTGNGSERKGATEP